MPKISKKKKNLILKSQRMNEILYTRRATADESQSQPQEINAECIETSEVKFGQTSFQCENIPITQLESKSVPLSLVGKRIVDVRYFYEELKKIADHGPLNCGLSCIEIVAEKQKGWQSKFTLCCKMCNQRFYITNEAPHDLDSNSRAVAGTISIGCGHSQLQELSASLDLPMITQNTYKYYHDKISTHWEKVALNEMSKAAEEERHLAVTEGRVDKHGTPIIDVIVDGCWSKRTYKKNYSALSGAAAIIGKRTGNILFLGVKNKYCCICALAETKKQDPKEHVCYKNYSGSSTGMESAILVEGFKTSIERHNLIYGRMVSDGDSSTYSKLLESRPYPHHTIQKIECRNHVLRNFCNKLENLKTDTKYILRYRKFITQKSTIVMRKAIRLAIKKYKTDSEPQRNANVELLYNDILLVHHHAFGHHSRCKPYFCSESEEYSTEAICSEFFTSNLWNRICFLISNVASHSASLIHDVDSNDVERYNSLVAKFVGGKRVNFSKKGSYQMRCMAAAVSFNTHKPLSLLYKALVGRSPSGKIKKLEERRVKRMKTARRYSRKKRKLFSKGQDVDYGEKCKKPDMSPDIYELEKNTLLQNLKRKTAQRKKTQEETILQSGSSEWMELRRNLLTASNFGLIIKKRLDTSCQNIVKNLLYKSNISNVESIKHGRDYEKIALQQLAGQEGVTIKPCGLFIDAEIPYLGATPDGIINEDVIVEVKCPITAFKLGFEEAVESKKITFFKKKNGQLEINKNHNWFYQVQGQLHITNASKCLFGIWHGEDKKLKVTTINKDDKFWKQKMEEKLVKFYIDCILPEIIDPRHTRSMPIRDPPYIEKAILKKQEKKSA